MKIPALILVFTMLYGCAQINVVPITDSNKASQKGLRIYGSKPLLLVSATETRVIYVPNYNEQYAINFNTFMAKNDFMIKLDGHGAITELSAKPDATTFLGDLLDFAAEPVKQGSEEALRALFSGGGNIGRMNVFDIRFDKDGNVAELVPLLKPETVFVEMPMNPAVTNMPTSQEPGGKTPRPSNTDKQKANAKKGQASEG